MILRRATRADAEALARLHAEALPASLLTELGHAAIVRYYLYVEASAHEQGWVAFDQGTVVGGLVITDDPGGVLGRFARHAPVALAGELARGLARPRLRARFRRRFGERSDAPHAPEVTQIFTDARCRGRGIGAALLRACEDALRSRGVRSYFVHTERDDNDAGIRFYQREGFVTIGASRSFGTEFHVMQKDLA
ncbi:MAG TPA: GNAT family N-acetyltransferase [Kofleriaceae bacterium]|nr:GNAT family N-acetyltransferase [Kofleriaceae bacterium]